MNRKLAVSVLSALLYAQGLLCFAGAAAVLLKDRGGPARNIAAAVFSSVSDAVG